MKLKRPRNERTRLMLTLELAVVLPAAALVILSALHLKTIERDRGVQAAFQRDFSQVLAISEKQMNQRAYELVDDVRDQFPASGAACAPTMDRILATHPYVSYLFVYDPETGLIFRSQPGRARFAHLPFRARLSFFHVRGLDSSGLYGLGKGSGRLGQTRQAASLRRLGPAR